MLPTTQFAYREGLDTCDTLLCVFQTPQSVLESEQAARIVQIIIIISIKRGRQRKAERERYTPYQSEDPGPTIPTLRQEEEKGKNSRRLQYG